MKLQSLILICLYLITATSISAQTILRSNLDQFHCGLKVQCSAENITIKNTELEYWRIGEPDEFIHRGDLVDQKMRIYEFSYLEHLSPLREFGHDDLVVAPLQPADECQFQKHIMSFWECRGDSLRLISIAPEGRISSPHRYRLSEARAVSKNRVAIFASSENVDAGDVWGKVDVYLFDRTLQKSELVHTECFSWIWCTRSDTLSASWNSESGTELRLIRRIVEGVRKDPTLADCPSVTVSADTTYLEIKDLEQ